MGLPGEVRVLIQHRVLAVKEAQAARLTTRLAATRRPPPTYLPQGNLPLRPALRRTTPPAGKRIRPSAIKAPMKDVPAATTARTASSR